jgi:thiopeptide-type bacteriocin biosynthesis protein
LISPRQWRITSSLSAEEIDAELAAISEAHECRYVQAGVGDQLLTADLKSARSRSLLITELKRKQLVWVSEVPQQDPFSGKSAEREICFSSLGSPMGALASSKLEHPYAAHDVESWVYFRIACKEEYFGTLIRERVAPLVELLKSRVRVMDWHFLIYPVPSPHLRLRFRADADLHDSIRRGVKDAMRVTGAAVGLYSWEEHPYLQETTRYGQLMPEVHRQWTADSEFAAHLWALDPASDLAAAVTRITHCADRWASLIGDQDVLRDELRRLSKSYDFEFSKIRKKGDAAKEALRAIRGVSRMPHDPEELRLSADATSLVPHLVHLSAARVCARDLRRTEWLAYGALWRRYSEEICSP